MIHSQVNLVQSVPFSLFSSTDLSLGSSFFQHFFLVMTGIMHETDSAPGLWHLAVVSAGMISHGHIYNC